MRRLILVLVFVPIIFSSRAQNSKKIPSEKPTLIVNIVVNQMRYDYIRRYWKDFEDGGFKKLINEGTLCRDAEVNYLFTQSSVGQASITTGTYPSYHGIVGDQWYNHLEERVVRCTEDQNYKTIGGSYEAGQNSPVHLMATTFSDELILSNYKKSKVFGISLEPNESILSVGHAANAAFWFDIKNGDWVSSSFYLDSLPTWTKDFNAKKLPDTYLERTWEPLKQTENVESWLENDKFETGFRDNATFPYDLKKMRKKYSDNKQYELLKYIPYGNNFTKDFAIALIVNEELGKDEYTDYLGLNFSATQTIGSKFGPTSQEIQDTYLRLDKELAHFLTFLDENIGKEKVLIVLTSTSGVSHIPSFLQDAKIPGGYFNHYSAITLLKSYLNAIYGEGDWVKFYHSHQIYLNRQLIEDANIKLEDFQSRVAQFLIQFEGVANTVTANTLHTRNFTKGILEKIQNGYNQKHSGDVILNLKPGWVEKSDNSTGTNSSYKYDTHVPLIWYGWKVKRQKINRKVEIIDIAPTLSSFLDISFPGAAIGTPIIELIE